MSTDKLRDGRRPPFYIIDNAIIDEYATKIGVYGIAVYNLIARHADANGENAFPSLTTITKKLGIGRTKAAETIQLLIDTGLIEKERRTDEAGDASANLYTIVHLGGSTQSVPPSTQPVPQVVLSEYQGSTQRVLYKDTIKKTPTLPPPSDGGEVKTSKKKGKPKVSDEEKARRKELKTAWVEANKAENYIEAQVNTGIEQLDKANTTPEELTGCHAWMAVDPYWENKTIYPQSIFKKLDEYRRFRQRVHTNGNGKTSTWAQAFANQEVPDYIRKMQEAA
jgi:hypothetical protein